MTPPDPDTRHNIWYAGTQYYSNKKEKKKMSYVNTKANTFHDRSLFCSDRENIPACFLQYTWYLVRGLTSCTPTCFVDATTAHISLKLSFIKMLIKNMVQYPNDPLVLCTVRQPLSSRKSSTHQSGQYLVIKTIAYMWYSYLFKGPRRPYYNPIRFFPRFFCK